MAKDRPNYPDGESITDQLDMIKRDEAFINALSEGKDPSDGKDALAAALLGLKSDIDRDMPAVPTLAELGLDDADSDLPDGVVSLSERRRKRAGAFTHGLVGAAAATLVIGGFGTAIHAAEPGDALYGLNQQVFGSNSVDSQVVELASTLDEANQKSEAGDVEGARELLEQARLIVANMDKGKQGSASQNPQVETQIVTTEVPTTVVIPAEAPAEVPPVTVTVTQTEQIQVPVPVNPAPSEGTGPEQGLDPVAPVETAQPAPSDQPAPTLPLEVPNP